MIKEYRIMRKMTQEKLAEKLSISVRHLQDLEHNRRMPSIKLLAKIITTLKVNDFDIIMYIKSI